IGVRDADEWKLQEPPVALLGPDVRMVSPSDVGQRADRQSEPLVGRHFAGKQSLGPFGQSRSELGDTGEGYPKQPCPLDEGVEIALGGRQLRIKPALA